MTGDPATLAAAAPALVASGGIDHGVLGQIDATNYAIVATTASQMTAARTIIGRAARRARSGTDGRHVASARLRLIVGGYFDASSRSHFILEK